MKPVINGSWVVKAVKVKDWMDKCFSARICKDFISKEEKKAGRQENHGAEEHS